MGVLARSDVSRRLLSAWAAALSDAGAVQAGANPREPSAVTLRVVVADDQPVVRAGFAALLDAQPDLTVVGEAADGDELVRIAAAGATTKILVVTTFDLDAYEYDALRAGASGFVLKDVPAARLVEAVPEGGHE